ncbi:MAG: carboxypeptidase-like regulatory domain-containing protein [Prolixibacteraceae bacterium]
MKLVFYLLFYFCPLFLSAQMITLSGRVEDATSGERLINATLSNKSAGTVTNGQGFFILSTVKGTHRFLCSYVGYNQNEITINIKRDTVIVIQLIPNSSIEEVVVSSTNQHGLYGNTESQFILTSKQINEIPVLLGESDVIKAIQFLPGVQACNEASGALLVRGGGADGNIILLDDVSVFNVSHLWGLFSVFDPNALKSVQFYNGGFPARYGGRTSSILDLKLKDGNRYEYHGNVTVGISSSKLFLEGPLAKNKSSFMFSARRTYIDIPLTAYQKLKHRDYSKYKNGYYFYDLIGKLTFELGKYDRLFLSIYNGKDNSYQFEEKDTSLIDNASLKWGNRTTAMRWNRQWSAKLFSNLTATHTWYSYYTDREFLNSDTISFKSFNYNYDSYIRDVSLKLDGNYYLSSKIKLEFGLFASHKNYNTGTSNYFIQNSSDTADYSNTIYAVPLFESDELGTYLSGNLVIARWIHSSMGIRLLKYSQGSKNYYFAEPRIVAKIVPQSFSGEFEIAYSKMHQNLHLLSNYGVDLPVDLWVPATNNIAPVQSEQYSTNFNYPFSGGIRISLGVYFKGMNNLIEYKNGEGFSATDVEWENKIAQGEGRSKGIEFLVEKQNGKFTGWGTYTLANTERRFDGINNGTWFPYSYDHRHEVNIAANYQLKKGIKLNVAWVFATGRAVTLPESKYFLEYTKVTDSKNDPYYVYSERNGYRMPPYHRLDCGASFEKIKAQGKRTWVVGIYNLYNRKNPYFVSIKTDGSGVPQFETNSLLPLIPYISYSYEF